jgi:hypothetical protein
VVASRTPGLIGLSAGVSGIFIALAELSIRMPEEYREATWASYLGIALLSAMALAAPRLAPLLLTLAPLPLYLLDMYMFLGVFWWPAPLVPSLLSAWAMVLAYRRAGRPPAEAQTRMF